MKAIRGCLLALLMAGVGFAVGRIALRPERPVSQPIAFSHFAHVNEAEIECDTCHQFFSSGEHAGLPSVETCMECHEDGDRAGPSDPTRPQVHNPEGGFFVEDHEGFVCIDCHTYIEDLEHDMLEGDPQVDCLECHDEVPTKE